MKRKLPPIILFIILLIGILLRINGTVTNSFAFTYDVGRDMLALQQIVYHYKIPLIGFTTGMPGIFYGPWWYFLLVPSFVLSGGDPRFVASFIALLGIVTILLMYYVGKKTDGTYLGITLALLVSFSPVLIGLSSQIWNPDVAPFYIALSLLVILRILEKPGKLMFFFLGVLSGLLIDTEIVFGLLLFVSYCIGLPIVARRKVFTRQVVFFVAGLLLIFSPRILFEFRHQFLMTKAIINMLAQIGNTSGSSSSPLFVKDAIFFNQFSDALAGPSHLAGIVLLIILFALLIIFARKVRGKEQQLLFLSLITIAIFIIGISFFKHDIWSHYLIGLPMFYILALGIILNQTRKHLRFGNILFVISLFILSLINLQPIQLIKSYQQPLYIGDASVYRNQLAVLDLVYQKAHGQPFNEIVYTPPIYDYPYQYLFSWYGPRVYHYAPSIKKEKLLFVIIEPDTEHPTLLLDWIKLREHDGVIRQEWKLKSGITIQERER